MERGVHVLLRPRLSPEAGLHTRGHNVGMHAYKTPAHVLCPCDLIKRSLCASYKQQLAALLACSRFWSFTSNKSVQDHPASATPP